MMGSTASEKKILNAASAVSEASASPSPLSRLGVHLFQHLNTLSTEDVSSSSAITPTELVTKSAEHAIQILGDALQILMQGFPNLAFADTELNVRPILLCAYTHLAYKGMVLVTTTDTGIIHTAKCVKMTEANAYQLVDLHYHVCLMALEAVYGKAEPVLRNGYRTQQKPDLISAWTTACICFPTAAHLLLISESNGPRLQKALRVLENPSLQRAGFWCWTEEDFKEILKYGNKTPHDSDSDSDSDNDCIGSSPSWSVLDKLVCKRDKNGRSRAMDMRTLTRKERWNLYLKQDVLDKYIRTREGEIRRLRFEVIGMAHTQNEQTYLELANEHATVRHTLTFCIDHLSSACFPGLTVRFHSYQEVLRPHPERDRINGAIGAWVASTFSGPGLDHVRQLYLTDKLLYDCVNYMYSQIDNPPVLIEVGKSIVLGLFMDTIAEEYPEFGPVLFRMFDFAQAREEDCPVEEFKFTTSDGDGEGNGDVGGQPWPEAYIVVCREFIKYCRNIWGLLGVNVAHYWRRWATSVGGGGGSSSDAYTHAHTHGHTSASFKSLDDYMAIRSLNIGMDSFDAVIAACIGSTLDEIPPDMRRAMTWIYVLENDFFSYGKELVEAGYDHAKILNAIEVYKNLHPELSYQDVVFELECFRDEIFDDHVHKWRGSAQYHTWYLTCIGLTHVTLNARRYAARGILSEGSLLILTGKGEARPDDCILAPIKNCPAASTSTSKSDPNNN